MRWMSFEYQGNKSYGFVDNSSVVDVGSTHPDVDLRTFIAHSDNYQLTNISDRSVFKQYDLSKVKFLPPIPNPDKILCVGLNYRDHQQETGRGGEAFPTIFTRFACVQVGHKDHLILPKESYTLDYEGEIALVIGKRGRHISKHDYLDHVAGFSCYNDATVREYQRHTSQFTAGKNFMATGGFGPWIVTPDEVGDLNTLELSTYLNGERMQYGKSSDLVFGFGELVEYCSTFVELEVGDVIVTGTPGGVGFARQPPIYLKTGDTVEIEISNVGRLQNRVTDAKVT